MLLRERSGEWLFWMNMEGGTNGAFVVPAEALMPTMLVQEHKDKTITHTVHEVLTWFGQPCLRPRMRENNSTIQ